MKLPEEKKVGIVSCYSFHNYGSMLQAYATQSIIEKLGYEPVTFQCDSPKKYMPQSKFSYYIHKLKDVGRVKDKIRIAKSKQKVKNKYPDVLRQINLREQYFERFEKNFFKISQPNNSREDLTNLSKKFSAVVVGSDQLWSPVNYEFDYYTLSFVPDEVRKISYATSIGRTSIPQKLVKAYRDYLARFFAISVREYSAKELLKNIGIENVTVVLDPTLLLTGEDWMEIQKEEPIYQGDYIFCYFLGVNQKHREFVRKLKDKTGYRIITLRHCDEFVEQDEKFGDYAFYDVGPSEFVNLIRNAQFVCTDSFHGSCFSILNHKRFFTFNRYEDNDTQSTNTRIDSLLSLTGLEYRRLMTNELNKDITNSILESIDYEDVDKRLNIERKRSIGFLKDTLEGKVV